MTSALARQFDAMGAAVPAAAVAVEDDAFGVWDMNWKAVALFLTLQTQWRSTGLSLGERAIIRLTGLDYAVVPVVMDMLGIAKVKERRRLFAQLRVLESTALETLGQVS